MEPKRRRVRNDNGNNHFRQVTHQYKIEVQGKKSQFAENVC